MHASSLLKSEALGEFGLNPGAAATRAGAAARRAKAVKAKRDMLEQMMRRKERDERAGAGDKKLGL